LRRTLIIFEARDFKRHGDQILGLLERAVFFMQHEQHLLRDILRGVGPYLSGCREADNPFAQALQNMVAGHARFIMPALHLVVCAIGR
jgi:hypothetical protein